MWELLAQYLNSSSKGSNAGMQGGTGGASGYGLANTASVQTGAQASGPFMSSKGNSTWTIASGNAKASATNGAIPSSYMVVGGVVLAVVLWKKLK